MVISVWLLEIPMKILPVRTACIIWVGIGAVGMVIFGIELFGESCKIGRLLIIGLIVAGIIGLKLTP